MRSFYLEPLESRIAPATLSIAPFIVDEGDEGTVDKVKTVTVKLDTAVAQDFTVHYTLVDGTATLGNQYSALDGQTNEGTLTFTAGQTEATIQFVVNGNSTENSDSKFLIKLDSATNNVTLPSGNGTEVTIWDDDRTINFTQTSLDQQVLEGSAANPGSFLFTPVLSSAADHNITFTFKTSAHGSGYGDATTDGAAADYTAVTTTFTFLAGQTTPSIGTTASTGATVMIKGDALPGPDEVFNASLSFAAGTTLFGAKLGDKVTTTATILNDDGNDQSDLTVSLVSATASGAEGVSMPFAIKLSRLSESPVLITYHTSDGLTQSATAGVDYTAAPNGTIGQIKGELTDNLFVPILADTHIEKAETFQLTLEGATVNGVALGLGATKTATGTILADALPTLVFEKVGTSTGPAGDVDVFESVTGALRSADFKVKLVVMKDGQAQPFDLLEAITVDYSTFSGTALEGADFTHTAGTLTFGADTTNTTAAQTISVPILADIKSELSETFTLKLSNAQGAGIPDNTAVGTILDSTVTIKVSDVRVAEGNQGTSTAVFSVSTGKAVPTGYHLVLDYALADGTAIHTAAGGSPADYLPAAMSGQFSFAPGTSFKTLSVPIVGDTIIEGNETFTLKVTNARLVPDAAGGTDLPISMAGAVEGALTGTATIVNDDGASIKASITAASVSKAEGPKVQGTDSTADFNIHLSQAYAEKITVHYVVVKTLADGTTTNSGDQTIDIDPYLQDKTLSIAYDNDEVVGKDQTITVTITSLTSTLKAATLAPLITAKTAKTTILEDDFYVQISDASVAEGALNTSTLMTFDVQLVAKDGSALARGLDHAVTVPFHTIDGTGIHGATSTGTGADFLAKTGTVVFAASAAAPGTKTVDITIRGDNNWGIKDSGNPDGNEFFTVKLDAPSTGQIRPTTTVGNVTTDYSDAVGTIVNDDNVDPNDVLPTLSVVQLAAGVEPDPTTGFTGSPATVQVVLSHGFEQSISFEYATSLITGTAGHAAAAQEDFTKVPADPVPPATTVVPATGTIVSGQTATTLSISVLADTLNENTEFFGVDVSHITGLPGAESTTVHGEGSIAANDQPTLTVANVSKLEGQAGETSSLTFQINLSAITDRPVTFFVETLSTGGTATADGDYVSVAKKMVTIPAGSQSVSESVTIIGDGDVGEGNETFIFRVSEVDGAVVGTANGVIDATGTILNDEAAFTITQAATVTEHGEVVTLTVTRTGEAVAADVTFQTIADTASSTNAAFPDFVGGTGTLHFAANETTKEIKVAIVDNNRHESDETFRVVLTGTSNGTLGTDKTATVTITDDDAVPVAKIISPAAVVEKDTGFTTVTFTVSLDRANEADDILLRYSTENIPGSAIGGQDYVTVTDQLLTIEKGTLSKSFTIQVINDTSLDLLKTESFKVNVVQDPSVTNSRVSFGTNVATLTGTGSIIDNEIAPQVSVSASTFLEGGSSFFNVQLSHASDKEVTVKYYTVNGTAVAGVDFEGKTAAAPGVIRFAPGTTSMILAIDATDDELVEGSETFKVQLAAPVGATLNKATSVATGTIQDNDLALVTINDVTILEGDNGTQDAIFTVSLLGETVVPVTLDYQTGNVTATAGQDYIATAGSLTLGGKTGKDSAQIVVKVVGDLIKESANETFKLLLSNVKVGTLASAFGTATIQDNGDTQATISVSDAAIAEGTPTFDPITGAVTNNGDTKLTFTVTASDVLDNDVFFTVKTSEILKAGNVARLGSDFLQPKNTMGDTSQDLVVKIPKNDLATNPNDTNPHSVTFDVVVKGDAVFEATEFLNVTLTNIQGAQPGDVTGVGTIYDNDVFTSARLIKWTDVDGDIVSLTASKGNLLTAGFNLATEGAGSKGGRILKQLDLVSQTAGLTFHRANISITSAVQNDVNGQAIGDGRVNVGYIRANNYDSVPTLLELKGIDLGTVTVDGDLARISAGDLYNDYAIGVLSTYSIGVNSATTEATPPTTTPLASQIIAGVGTIKVTNDISGYIAVTGGTTGRIGNLIIGGALRGTALDQSATIVTTGAITKATIGSIIGGEGNYSAGLRQFDTTASLGSLTVTGDITAGKGVESAYVLFPTIGSVTIGGSMVGNNDGTTKSDGSDTGTTTGSTGGGFISGSNSLGTVTIGGDFKTGARILGGGLKNNVAINSVVIHGNVDGGQIKGGYVGFLADSIASTTTVAKAAENKVNADAQITSVEIDGTVKNLDILAGTNSIDTSTTTDTAFQLNNGSIFSRIAKVIFNGEILAGTAQHFVSAESIGTIIVQGVAKTASTAGNELTPGSNLFLKYAS